VTPQGVEEDMEISLDSCVEQSDSNREQVVIAQFVVSVFEKYVFQDDQLVEVGTIVTESVSPKS
jgi:hypothetical protein